MARRYTVRVTCGHEGCEEYAHYEADTRRDQSALFAKYGQGKWLCVRHTQPDEVLSPTNLRRIKEMTSEERPHGIYWGSWGFVSGPGFKAFAKDFPPGTTLRVTSEIILPMAAIEEIGK